MSSFSTQDLSRPQVYCCSLPVISASFDYHDYLLSLRGQQFGKLEWQKVWWFTFLTVIFCHCMARMLFQSGFNICFQKVSVHEWDLHPWHILSARTCLCTGRELFCLWSEPISATLCPLPVKSKTYSMSHGRIILSFETEILLIFFVNVF